jgi:hypothetical protein
MHPLETLRLAGNRRTHTVHRQLRDDAPLGWVGGEKASGNCPMKRSRVLPNMRSVASLQSDIFPHRTKTSRRWHG